MDKVTVRTVLRKFPHKSWQTGIRHAMVAVSVY